MDTPHTAGGLKKLQRGPLEVEKLCKKNRLI